MFVAIICMKSRYLMGYLLTPCLQEYVAKMREIWYQIYTQTTKKYNFKEDLNLI